MAERRLEMGSLLGQGRFGQVFSAVQQLPGGKARRVAVRKLTGRAANDARLLAFFDMEARVSAALDHPALLHVYEVIKGPEGRQVVMEAIDGLELDQILKQVHSRGRLLPTAAVVEITRVCSELLAHAHRACDRDGTPLNLIHRGLHPASVWITTGGQVKVTDFGGAACDLVPGGNRAGVRQGPPWYLAPEQAAEDLLDNSVDQYVVGLILVEMLLGEPVFGSGANLTQRVALGDVREALDKLMERIQKSTPDNPCPIQLHRIASRALAANSLERFTDQLALAQALAALQKELGGGGKLAEVVLSCKVDGQGLHRVTSPNPWLTGQDEPADEDPTVEVARPRSADLKLAKTQLGPRLQEERPEPKTDITELSKAVQDFRRQHQLGKGQSLAQVAPGGMTGVAPSTPKAVGQPAPATPKPAKQPEVTPSKGAKQPTLTPPRSAKSPGEKPVVVSLVRPDDDFPLAQDTEGDMPTHEVDIDPPTLESWRTRGAEAEQLGPGATATRGVTEVTSPDPRTPEDRWPGGGEEASLVDLMPDLPDLPDLPDTEPEPPRHLPPLPSVTLPSATLKQAFPHSSPGTPLPPPAPSPAPPAPVMGPASGAGTPVGEIRPGAAVVSPPAEIDLLGDWGQVELPQAAAPAPSPAPSSTPTTPQPMPGSSSRVSSLAKWVGSLGALVSAGLGVLVGLSMAWRDHVPDVYAPLPAQPAAAAVAGAGGDLIINVVPADAELYVGDQKVPGQTPFRLAALPVNVPQVVTLKAPGYDPLVRTVTPRSGESTLDLVLNRATSTPAPQPAAQKGGAPRRPTSAPIQEGGFLVIKTVPNSADVFVSGNKVGITNAGKIMVSAGSVEVVLRDRSTMEAKAFTVKLAVGEQRNITYDFQEKAFVR